MFTVFLNFFLYGQKKKKYNSTMFGDSAEGQLSLGLT